MLSRLFVLLLSSWCSLAIGQTNRESWHVLGSKFVPLGFAVSSNGTTFVAANWPNGPEAQLFALNSMGEELWSVTFTENLGGPPVIDDKGQVLVVTLGGSGLGNGLGRLVAFEADGRQAWEFSDPCDFNVPVVRSGGDLLLGSEQRGPHSGTRYGRNRYILSSDGSVRWALTNNLVSYAPLPGVPPLVIGEQQLWFPVEGGVELFQPGAGPAWSRLGLGYPAGVAPAPGGGLYVVTSTGLLNLRSDGSTVWSIANTNLSSDPVLGTDGTLYVGTSTNALVAFSNAGAFLWATPAEGTISVPAAVGQDGAVFFGTDSGTFHAVNADGSARWSFQADAGLSTAPTITPEQRVIFGTTSGAIWALRADTALAETPWPKYQGNLGNQGRTEGHPPYAIPERIIRFSFLAGLLT